MLLLLLLLLKRVCPAPQVRASLGIVEDWVLPARRTIWCPAELSPPFGIKSLSSLAVLSWNGPPSVFPSAEGMSLLEKLWSQLTSSVTLKSKHALFLSSIFPAKPGQSNRVQWRVTSNEDPSKGWDQCFVHYPVKFLVPLSLPSSHGGR